MRTVVTGAAGFIGSTLVDRLLDQGHSVVGIDSMRTGSRTNLNEAFNRRPGGTRDFCLVETDVRNSRLIDLMKEVRPDVVFHLAAQVDVRASVARPAEDAEHNILGTINVLQASRAAEVTRFVYAASGGSRYGAPTQLPVSESAALAPMSPYAAAKLAGEMYLEAYSAMYGISTIALGLSNVYGPRQNPHGEAGVVAIFGSAMISGRPVTIYGDGSTTRDYVYVGDVVDAFLLAARAPEGIAGTYNIGTGLQTAVEELYRLIAAATGSPAAPTFAPARSGEVPKIALDNSKALAQLGWSPRVPLVEGVWRTVAWLRGSGDSFDHRIGAAHG